MKASFFRDTYDKKPHNVEVKDVLMAIKEGRWEDKIVELRESKDDKLKSFLPAITWAGTFKDERKASNIDVYTGLITIDIDDKNKDRIKALKKLTKEDPFIFASFVSPRGGLKILLRVDSSKEYHKTHAYLQCKDWMQDNYPDVVIDKSGSDVSRLCYISYDPELHHNPNSQVLPIDTSIVYEKPIPIVAATDIDWSNRETDTQKIFDLCQTWVNKRGLYYGRGSRNNYIHNIANLLNEAGLSESQIISIIATNHSISNDMNKELRNVVFGVCRRKAGKKGSLVIKSKNNNSLF